MDENIFKNSDSAYKLLGDIASKVPASVIGLEKQKFIGEKILPQLPENHILLLQDLFKSFLSEMRRCEASDIDLGGWGSNGFVWLRIHGRKTAAPALGRLDETQADILIQSLLMPSQRQHLYKYRNLDFSYITRETGQAIARYRADAYFESGCLALNMRAINTKIFDYQGYGFHPNVTKVLSLAHTKEGLILVTGITGSGKSSTLDAIVDLNNRTVDGHIIIIASPVEFVHQSSRCLIRHREVGRDTHTFKSGTIEALRQDPDVIIIGEMRDPETIMAGLEAADSGHKVLSTLHTSSAVESIERIIGEMPTAEQNRVRNRLGDTLRAVISQKLIPAKAGGRILAKEILLVTPSVRAAILNNNIGEIYQMISQGNKLGMRTIEQDLARLVLEGKVTISTAVNFANNKRRLEQILKLAQQEQRYHG